MKKTLLAAALTLGFAGIAQAETSVTLYGIVDAGIGYQQIKGNSSYSNNRTDATDFKATKTGMITGVQSGNRWGLKGVEDLGEGLRAVFVLESGFDIGTGGQQQGGRLFGRQATLGLAGDSWGQLDFGRQTNIASKYLLAAADPFGGSFGQANLGAAFTSANTVRYDNMVMYQTPNYSGFQLGAGYSFNTDGGQSYKITGPGFSGDELNKRGITAGIRYANGPVAVALTYDQVKTPSVSFPARDSVNVKAWALGGSYDFEVVKVHAAYGQTRNGFFAAESFGVLGSNVAAVNGDGMKFNSYMLGLSAPIGNGKIMASWQMADPRSAPDAWNVPGADYDLKKQQTYSIGYTYGLSKRTNLYAMGSYAKNLVFLPDAKSTVVGVGIRHQF